ncbi:DNA gyrase inhibitor YacG [Parasphingorhabdus halotolerans]|uniref:DNA gyrase inhibitor YacG n=1 Tax=Parasphingorhabdus halotolerans TaxID=2725558 RepID=A0A6H2DQM4_9SPHN|nr:DNA gyrase inhibitor YacG [Parasphingorhabdus halotolerans]QJB70700.1 DNA gyrase inhibitor YacG [Parasphingorhabdus halotolerans]
MTLSQSKFSKCPVCKKPQASQFKPFCSAGCKDRDLLQWLGEGYRVPGPAVSPDQLMDHFADNSGRDGEA